MAAAVYSKASFSFIPDLARSAAAIKDLKEQGIEMENNKLIQLPSGDSVRPLNVSAVRIFKGFEEKPGLEGYGNPCVYVDTVKDGAASINIDVDSHEEAIKLAEWIMNAVNAERDGDPSATRRKVIVFEGRYSSDTKKVEKIEYGVGEFHQFGLSLELHEDGFGNLSIAIVEMPDGTVLTPPANMIKFVNDESESGNGISQ